MPWIPVWFDRDQWFDLATNFSAVWDVAQLEQPQREADLPLPPGYSFDAYFTPTRYGNPQSGPPVGIIDPSGDRVNTLFMNASREVFQKLIGTTLQLVEEIRKGHEVQLQLPDGSVRRVVMSLPNDPQRPRFSTDLPRGPESK